MKRSKLPNNPCMRTVEPGAFRPGLRCIRALFVATTEPRAVTARSRVRGTDDPPKSSANVPVAKAAGLFKPTA